MIGILRVFATTVTLIAVSACGHDARRATLEYVGRPVNAIYTAAYDLILRQRWEDAALQFEDLQRQHPYSEWARRSMLMAAYARYRGRDYDQTINSARNYIALFPGSRETPYAYYLIGLSHFKRMIDVKRGQQPAREALSAFTELIRRFPNTDYSRDASLKIELINNALAGHDMVVGRYYLKKKNYLAATNRFQSVIINNANTSQTPEALHRMVEINISLGLTGEAQKALALLDYNFPDSVWTHLSRELIAQTDNTAQQ